MAAQGLTAQKSGPVSGTARVPGDKSISHRALLLGAVAVGDTTIHGLLESQDVLCTARAVSQLGALVTEPSGDGAPWIVSGAGIGGLYEPDSVLDMGNSGTAARLLSGLIAGHPITAFLTGDGSLVRRPMTRVTAPLEQMGASFVTRRAGRLPMAVTGPETVVPITYELPVASAQVKSAVLLAGLSAPGVTTVIETRPTRDHTELMLRHFGAELQVIERPDGCAISLTGQPEFVGRSITIPADISSAAFPLVAALICPGSEVLLPNVGSNPRRTGLIETLKEMGADIATEQGGVGAGEPVATLRVRTSALKGVTVPPERAPSMIDEYPILAIAAACADGTTAMLGIGELRVKESDRIARMVAGLSACGVRVEATEDSLTVHGTGHPPAGGASIATDLDHRIAMSFLMLGLATDAPIAIDDADPIDTSFPGFVSLMARLGARISGADPILEPS